MKTLLDEMRSLLNPAETAESEGLDEAKKAKAKKAKAKHKTGALGKPDSKNAKRRALIKKLKKNKSVRNPEALATWIGLRKAGALEGAEAQASALSFEDRQALEGMAAEEENAQDEKKSLHGRLALIAKTLGYDLSDTTSADQFMTAVRAAVTSQKPQLIRLYGKLTTSREKAAVAQMKKSI